MYNIFISFPRLFLFRICLDALICNVRCATIKACLHIVLTNTFVWHMYNYTSIYIWINYTS